MKLIFFKFAKAAGAKVIATTSTADKAEKLKELGADHVINYKENPNWGQIAKNLTPNNEGVSLVVEVGGPSTAREVCEAYAPRNSFARYNQELTRELC